MRECCRQSQAEVVSKNRNKFHQTWGPPFSRALYTHNDVLALLPKADGFFQAAAAAHLHFYQAGDVTRQKGERERVINKHEIKRRRRLGGEKNVGQILAREGKTFYEGVDTCSLASSEIPFKYPSFGLQISAEGWKSD